MKNINIKLAEGSRIEDVISGTIKYNDMHGSLRNTSINPFVRRITELESQLETVLLLLCEIEDVGVIARDAIQVLNKPGIINKQLQRKIDTMHSTA